MKAIRLQTEYLTNPIGIDIRLPRLFWNCEEGITQTAYEIEARDESGEIVWNSGKTKSRQMTHIPYEGKMLKSRDRIFWKVRLWDEEDEVGEWSQEAFFEMGLLNPEEWKADWITGNYNPDKKKRYPVDCFRKKLKLTSDEEIVKARLYATACGVYEAKINGKRVGDYILAPGITDYRKRVQYQTYDVTELLTNAGASKDREAESVLRKEADPQELTFQLADGWYRGSVGAWGMRNYYGSETKLIAQLEILYADGSVQVVGTDASFEWSNDGPIRFADNKDGEKINASFAPSYYSHAKVTKHSVTPAASNNVPITEHEQLKPVMIKTPKGRRVLDFGQNIAGYIQFSVTAKKGQRLHLRFGEMLDENGEFTQKNIQCSNKRKTSPLQEVKYICREGVNDYKTTFAIFGFQYVEVKSEVPIQPEQFTAIAVYSDMEQRTTFDSSNALLNQFVESTLWSTKNNSADLPTDCPTRERHGWSGDAQLFFNTAAYLVDYASFARKYEKDLTDWQTKDGKFPQIAPEGGTDPYMRVMNGSSGWADAGVLIPYRFWKIYGDTGILRENYEAMKRYAGFVQKRLGKNALISIKHHVSGENAKYIVNTGQAYGEWAEPTEVHEMSWKDFVVPPTEVSTAYAAYVMKLMAEIAEELGKQAEAKNYRELYEHIRKAYQEYTEKESPLDTDRQARLVRPLYFDLLEKEQKEYAQKRLIQALENYGWRLGTGFLSTPLILDVLQEYDLDAAYRLLENEEMPGWLFMSKAGANTIWESWEGTKAQGEIASLNHYSKGACCEWLFREMCGIHVTGENHFVIAPHPGGHFTHASTSYQSVYGLVKSGWEKTEEGYIYTIEIPANCDAEIKLPDGSSTEVKTGVYRL
ncbi:MAG: family 78 glycoside hydrolase catalytic domain [Eubacteriales bacterium]|nr:family 78 glycoside hydrolase catalytic domain [Eubacteriales bacterium]